VVGNVNRGGHDIDGRPGPQGGCADDADIAIAAGDGEECGLDVQQVVAQQDVALMVETPGRAARARRAHRLLAEA
jgi:hypothetical protein